MKITIEVRRERMSAIFFIKPIDILRNMYYIIITERQ